MNTLSKETIKEICNKYPKNNIATISREYQISEPRLKRLLIENGIKIQNPKQGSVSNRFEEMIHMYYPDIEGKHYIAISKIDGSETNDYLNQSGYITKYLKENGINVPSSYKRLKYLEKNKCLWHSQYFDIVIKDNNIIKAKKCPYCSWETNDIENRSGGFIRHIIVEHNITKEQYLIEHPEDREYLLLANKTENRQVETDDNKYVTCAICGRKLARIDWRHLIKHNMSKEEYVFKYTDNTVSTELHDKLSSIMVEANKTFIPSYESKAEQEIKELISSYGIECGKERKLFDGYEMDICIPSKKICIEYNGIYYHTEWFGKKDRHYHINKLNKCKEKGFKLIHIFEDEYETKKDIVLNKIEHLLGIQTTLPKIMGRKCVVKDISKENAREFLEKFHIQGNVDSSVRLGCFYNDKLIAVMQFRKICNNEWELTRFASDYNYVCQGVGGKLFKHFLKTYNPLKIKSFADRRWTIDEENNIYIQLGFKFETYTKPDYHYVNRKIDKYKRFHKFNFRKQRLHKKYGFPLTMTETEMVKKLGCDRIWDCGLIKYVWESSKE